PISWWRSASVSSLRRIEGSMRSGRPATAKKSLKYNSITTPAPIAGGRRLASLRFYVLGANAVGAGVEQLLGGAQQLDVAALRRRAQVRARRVQELVGQGVGEEFERLLRSAPGGEQVARLFQRRVALQFGITAQARQRVAQVERAPPGAVVLDLQVDDRFGFARRGLARAQVVVYHLLEIVDRV